MKIEEIEISDQVVIDRAIEIAAQELADDILKGFGSDYRAFHKAAKEVMREAIKPKLDDLMDVAVKAAAKSIENRAIKNLAYFQSVSEMENIKSLSGEAGHEDE